MGSTTGKGEFGCILSHSANSIKSQNERNHIHSFVAYDKIKFTGRKKVAGSKRDHTPQAPSFLEVDMKLRHASDPLLHAHHLTRGTLHFGASSQDHFRIGTVLCTLGAFLLMIVVSVIWIQQQPDKSASCTLEKKPRFEQRSRNRNSNDARGNTSASCSVKGLVGGGLARRRRQRLAETASVMQARVNRSSCLKDNFKEPNIEVLAAKNMPPSSASDCLISIPRGDHHQTSCHEAGLTSFVRKTSELMAKYSIFSDSRNQNASSASGNQDFHIDRGHSTRIDVQLGCNSDQDIDIDMGQCKLVDICVLST